MCCEIDAELTKCLTRSSPFGRVSNCKSEWAEFQKDAFPKQQELLLHLKKAFTCSLFTHRWHLLPSNQRWAQLSWIGKLQNEDIEKAVKEISALNCTMNYNYIRSLNVRFPVASFW